ncbi:hypothetical protein LCGC14_1927970 [marine sediment metagenome]|uniref:Uncharacterized protein n=2 Tax=marine sediment metagenome TaxID=412755 RepID=A0A0F9I2Q5_9ZZZZ
MPGIVVEGCDGSGKTTLIRVLRDHFHWPVVHVVQPHNPDILQMMRLIECSPVIFDRFHWSPVVYGEALREGPELTPYDLWALDGMLMNRGFINVYCETDINTMLRNNVKEEQLWEAVRTKSSIKRIIHEYRMLEQTSQLTCYLYDYRAETTDTLLDLIKTMVGFEGPRGVQGHPQPTTWFVGDERADKGAKGISIPFYDVGISDQLVTGTLLHRALIENDLTWNKRVALSNSAGEDLQTVYSQLGEPATVVALGRVAAGRLADARIPAAYVPHPQWWRRFNHHDPNGYVKKIQEVVGR